VQVRLGKLPPKNDPRTLRLGNYLRAKELPSVPSHVDWTQAVGGFPMYANDRIGCCAIAGPAHLLQVWSANDATIVTPTEEQVLADYRTVSGWDGAPGSPSDVGCIMLDVLSRWRNRGLFGHRIAAYALVDHRNLDEVRAAVYLFGGVLLGVSLPAAVANQTNDEPWKAPINVPRFGPWSPGTWGGHAIVNCGYDPQGIPAITWGGVKQMSWHFFTSYVDECYVALSTAWVGSDSKAPNGFDALSLARDLGALG